MAEAVQTEEVVRIGRRCYVGNLAWRTSWQDLKDKFRECGNVVYANVMKDDAGRSKGWGIVEFETPEEAVQAVQTLNGTDLGGRKIMVREDREDRDVKGNLPANGEAPTRSGRGGAGGRGRGRGRAAAAAPAPAPQREGESSGLQVVVQGIPWKYTWRELKDLFNAGDFADIERADVVIGNDGRSRGYGTVRFSSPESAQAAIEKYNGTELESRTLTVKMDKFA